MKKERASHSRRNFIRNTAVAFAGIYIVPRNVLGGKGFIAPSDKLNIAGVGVGGKGTSDVLNAWNNGVNNIVALCDVDWGMGKASAEKFPNAKRYNDFREMLDKEKGIDAVTISTPDHMHAVIAMAAMQRGKHVYVQKPLTHDIYEARVLTEAARRYRVVTQMGNQGASGEGTRQMVEWFDKGLIGTVDQAHVWTNRPVWPQGIPVPTDKPRDKRNQLAFFRYHIMQRATAVSSLPRKRYRIFHSLFLSLLLRFAKQQGNCCRLSSACR